MSEILNLNKGSVLSKKIEDAAQDQMRNNSQEGGWEFWTRVYKTPELRQIMGEKAQTETPMAELLASSNLCRAELTVTNIPRLANSQQGVIRNLIQKEMRTNMPILEVIIDIKKWTIRFYRVEDAIRTLRLLDGYCFRGRLLHVSLSDFVMPTSPVKPADRSDLDDRNINWTIAEWSEMKHFKSDLIALLSRSPQGISISDALTDLRPMRRRGVVPSSLDYWPTALLRIFAPQVKMTGRYLSLAEHNNQAVLLRKVAAEGTPRVALESWEPAHPSEIRTDAQLTDYLAALLGHFGPQHVDLDLPLRLLATTLSSGNRPDSSRSLAIKATDLSPQFMIFDDILYLTTNILHRRHLLEYIQPVAQMTSLKHAPSALPSLAAANRHHHLNAPPLPRL